MYLFLEVVRIDVEEVEVDDMESVEDEEAGTSTPLLQYHFSKEEKQGGQLVGVESNRGGEDENDKEMLDLVVPFVSIVITQPTPELQRRTREGCLEEDQDDEMGVDTNDISNIKYIYPNYESRNDLLLLKVSRCCLAVILYCKNLVSFYI